MDQDTQQRLNAALALMDAQARMLRQVLRHLVEENYISPSKAAKIVLDAASESFPAAPGMGESYDLGRESLNMLATALLGWPESDRAPQSPQKDLG